jgi:hypothetical protein
MTRPTKCAVVIASSVVAGAVLFMSSFVVLDFVWTHFIVTDPKEIGMGDGVVVVGGGFIIGTILGLLGIGLVIYRFWPARAQSNSVCPPAP